MKFDGVTEAGRWTNEQRAEALESYRILDTPRERDFDELAEIASEVCEAPIAVVNLVSTNRQWFKAEVGLGVRETPFETSFCGHAILAADFMMVPDATKDARFNCNPLVTGEPKLRFYAGALIKTAEGLPLGTMCVLDYRPRELDAHQMRVLRLLARQAMTLIELRKSLAESEAAVEHQKVLSFELKHRMKNTLTMVQAIANQTLRPGISLDDARQSFTGRINALSSAQDILTQTSWSSATVGDLVRSALAAHGYDRRFKIEGPDLQLSARRALGLVLALHELATNAAKYGALSVPGGSVSVTWMVSAQGADPERFTFVWEERNGPEVAEPTRKGFGSTIIERLLAGYFNGEVALHFPRSGAMLRLDAPTASEFDEAQDR